jgi:Protein of unknown function (DUF2905)
MLLTSILRSQAALYLIQYRINMRWLLTFIIASIALSALWPAIEKLLGRFGIGKLPGDFKLRMFGRDWFFPLGSTLLFTALFWVVLRVLR